MMTDWVPVAVSFIGPSFLADLPGDRTGFARSRPFDLSNRSAAPGHPIARYSASDALHGGRAPAPPASRPQDASTPPVAIFRRPPAGLRPSVLRRGTAARTATGGSD